MGDIGVGFGATNFGFSRLSLVVRDSNFIEEAVQLPNNGPYLRGKVAGIHGGRAHSASA
jgi:hypothetical protein